MGQDATGHERAAKPFDIIRYGSIYLLLLFSLVRAQRIAAQRYNDLRVVFVANANV